MKEKLSAISLYSIGILSAIILFVLGIKYLIPLISPFLIAWIIVGITHSPAEKLSLGIRVPSRILRLMMSLFITAIAVFSLVVLIWQASSFALDFLTDFAESDRLNGLLSSLFSPQLPIVGEMISDDISTKLSSAVGNMITSALSSLAEGIASLVTALPQGFLFLLVTLISLVYFSLDYDRISDFIKSMLPKKIVSAIEGIKSKSIGMLGKYLRSYSLIIFVTYMILLIGFLILRIKNALFVALFVSVLDILPIIGVGTLLIPWGILEIAIGNKFVGIGLIILFLVNAIVRQFLEPKIIGKSLNIHPIATLIMIYIGYSLFGIMGLIILPAIAIVLSIVLGGNKTAKIG